MKIAGKDAIFSRALEELDACGTTPGTFLPPRSFQTYLTEQSIAAPNTASHISIDSYAGPSRSLPLALRERGVMVLRLGRALEDRGTQFTLVRAADLASEFFLEDERIFQGVPTRSFEPSPATAEALSAYRLFPIDTEAWYVNLALASGLLASALGLDPVAVSAPATGQTTFRFPVRPHRDSPGPPCEHRAGQVEFDALLVARRAGRPVLIVIEAKKSRRLDSLAKHKLVYPLLALSHSAETAARAPVTMPVIPVYMRVIRRSDGIHYYLAECGFPSPRPGGSLPAVDELALAEAGAHHLLLEIEPERGSSPPERTS